MPATYEAISTTTVTGSPTEIIFSAIPSTYTDLRLVLYVKSAAGGNTGIQFNSDTSASYSSTRLYAASSSTGSDRLTSTTNIGITSGNPTQWSANIVDIFNYTTSQSKSVLSQDSNNINGSDITSRIVGLWANSSAVSSIRIFFPSATTFVAGTMATIYGIKAA